MFFKALYYTCERVFQFYHTGLSKISFLMVPLGLGLGLGLGLPAFYDQVVAKLVAEPDTGNRNLEISLDTVREICTTPFYIVGLEEFR